MGALALTLAGGSMLTSMIQGNIQRRQANQQAKLHLFNARVAEEQIDEVEFQAGEQQRDIREMERRVTGQQRVAIGSSGFTFEGQRSRLISEAARNADRDAFISRRNFEHQKSGIRQQAAVERFRAKDVRAAGRINQFTSIISGGLNAGSRLLG
ncbi:MAG: hypothetical protein ACR2QF_04835 [Geminicoccaceae bacterium]